MEEFDNNEVTTYSLSDARNSLEVNSTRYGTAVMHGLSDIPSNDVPALETLWQSLPVDAKQQLVSHLIEVSEANFELNYRIVGLTALQDDDEIVRVRSIDLLWEDESTETLELLCKVAVLDVSEKVRAAAAGALGNFVLLGEYGKLSEQHKALAQDTAIEIWSNLDEANSVRRRALESIANSSHAIVPEAVLEGYSSSDDAMVISSIFAMGRTCDERWSPSVLKELSSEDPAHRYEAARAAGQLELKAAVQALGRMALTDERDIQEAAIWSLGEIGGDLSLKVLEKLEEHFAEDEALADLIDDALANAGLTMDMDLSDIFGLSSFDDYGDDEDLLH